MEPGLSLPLRAAPTQASPHTRASGHPVPRPTYQSPSMMSAQSSALPSPCSRLSSARMPAYT